MATKPALTIDSKARPLKKYLGDPSSPHFIPSSPLIDRQLLSFNDEEELKRACALALRDVQSSDDDEVDPAVAYLAGHIQEREQPEGTSDLDAAVKDSRPQVQTLTEQTHLLAKSFPQELETSVSSLPSNRTTSEPTDYSTPLTSSSIAPAETYKRASGPTLGFLSAKRGSSSSQGGFVDPKSPERAHIWMMNYLEKRMSKDKDASEVKRPETASARISTSRPSTNRATSKGNMQSEDSRGSTALSNADLNKRLPALPWGQAEPEQPKKQHITSMMKGFKRTKKDANVIDSADQENTPDLEMQFSASYIEYDRIKPATDIPDIRSSTANNTTLRLGPSIEQNHGSAEQEFPHYTQVDQVFMFPPRSASLPGSAALIQQVSMPPTSAKRRFFSKRFTGRFEWKRRKMPGGSVGMAPVLQVA